LSTGRTSLKQYQNILLIGIIEVAIGGITLMATFGSILLRTNTKPANVLFFVIIASTVSTLIGIGILKLNKLAYQALVYFSSVVVLSKILIFLGIMQLSGELETTIPSPVKSIISIGYHSCILFYLCKSEIKKIFHF